MTMADGASVGVKVRSKNLLNLLLVFVPVAIALHFLRLPGVWVFSASCLAIIPLAGLMGKATEELAENLGEGIGGLLNASFGNAAELIIAIMALRAGLHDASPDVRTSARQGLDALR